MGRPLRYATAFPPTMLPSLRRDYSHHKKERFLRSFFVCVQYEDLNILSSPREEAVRAASFDTQPFFRRRRSRACAGITRTTKNNCQ